MPGVIEDLSEEEKYLWAILSDTSGLDIAEFCWVDETQRHDLPNDEGEIDRPSSPGSYCWRARPYQWAWFRCKNRQQIDQCARSVGKSLSIQLRGFAFPFIHPGEEMVVTAPELNHLEPITDLIESRFRSVRLGQMMMAGGRSGITHRPFKMNFKNDARIMGRIPQKDGKGVKGIHPIWLELDEAQDYPHPGWIELNETLNFGKEGALWRAHGVTKGIRDDFFEYTQPDSGWKVHRFCLPGDTMVYGTRGPVAIAEIEPGTEVWTIDRDGQLSCDQVAALIPNGIQPIWRVKARGGCDLKSTANHPYLVLSRRGTPRTRRNLEFEWVEAQNLRPGDFLIAVDGLPAMGNRIPTTDEVAISLDAKSPDREIPSWIWEAVPQMQIAFLHGYLIGDGSLSRQTRGQDPWQIGTASIVMAKQLRALCHYLGLRCTALAETSGGDLGNGPQYRFCVYPEKAWFWRIPASYSRVKDGQMLEGLGKNFVARRVSSVEQTGEFTETFDITVGEDHNFIAEGIVVHNTAMHRPPPYWSDEERESKIKLYHGSDSGDYRRNILGEHGDSASPIFNLFRLMACVDDDQESNYNQDEYVHYEIIDSWLRQAQTTIEQELDLPTYHTAKYKTFWVGVDLGWTNHPTEICVFAEEVMSKEEYKAQKGRKDLGRGKAVPPNQETSRLKLVTRITLTRIAYPDQKAAFLKVIEHYKPKAFSFDATGAGQPVFQEIQDLIENEPHYDYIKTLVRGYNFSGNILVAFDDTIEVSEWATKEEYIKETGMKRNTVDYATDQLRILIDSGRFWLPWDVDLTNEFGGQTYKVASALNQWGRREYCVDEATEMMTAEGWKTHDQLTVGEEVLTLNPESLWSEFVPLEQVNRFEGERPMLSMENRGHSSLTTLDHRWLVRRRSSHTGQAETIWSKSSELKAMMDIPKVAPCDSLPQLTQQRDSLVELIGWYWTEGWSNDGACAIGQSDTANPAKVKRIRGALESWLGPARKGVWTECPQKNGMVIFRVSKSQSAPILAAVGRDKELLPSWLMTLTQDQLDLLIEVSIQADGHRSTTVTDGFISHETTFSQKSEARIRSFEMACALAGKATKTSTTSGPGMFHTRILTSRNFGPYNTKRTVVDHQGLVWCPTTRNGTFLARRNGTVFYTGNSLGKFHALDACRMMALGWAQYAIEEFVKNDPDEPVLDLFGM